MSSIDEIIDIYKRDADRTLIDACLQRTVEERIRSLEDFEGFLTELRRQVVKQRDAVR
jgi:hypothetical protein